MAARYSELSESLRLEVVQRIDDEFGLDCPQLYIVNVSLPEAVEKALDARTSIGVIGDLERYQQYQMGNAMATAAQNPAGGGAAEGMGLGIGLAMANRMVNPQTGAPLGGSAPPAPPGAVAPAAAAWHVAVGGQTKGPYSIQQLVAGITSGEVKADTMVWSAGMPSWTRADQVTQLATYFQAMAPPPPPPPAP